MSGGVKAGGVRGRIGGPAAHAGYAGDVSAREAWRLLEDASDALLLDVRTRAEWAYVGLPDISATGRPLLTVEWQGFPGGTPNPLFLAQAREELEAAGAGADAAILCLCRSGQRSAAAAAALTAAGFTRCFNVADGFEGPRDGEGRRGRVAGWKAAGLPWHQS